MSRAGRFGVAAGLAAVILLLWAATAVPFDVRHGAAYGFSKTIDFDRSLAVKGGYVVSDYPDFARVDLDLRSYSPDARYDLAVHIRSADAGTSDVRTVLLDVGGYRIPSAKGSFTDPFVAVRFQPMRDSAGRVYYVWVDSGPRNRDDVVALWSVKSYSRMTAATMVRALLNGGGDGAADADAVGLLSLAIASLVVVCALLGRLICDAVAARSTSEGMEAERCRA